jgi:hypothetical protein
MSREVKYSCDNCGNETGDRGVTMYDVDGMVEVKGIEHLCNDCLDEYDLDENTLLDLDPNME